MNYYDARQKSWRQARIEEHLAAPVSARTPRSPREKTGWSLSVHQLEEWTKKFDDARRFAEHDTRLYRKLVAAHERLGEDDAFARSFYARISIHAGDISPFEAGEHEDAKGTFRLRIGEADRALGGHQFALHRHADGLVRTGVLSQRDSFALVATPLPSTAAQAMAGILATDGAVGIPLYAISPAYLQADKDHLFNELLLRHAYGDEPV